MNLVNLGFSFSSSAVFRSVETKGRNLGHSGGEKRHGYRTHITVQGTPAPLIHLASPPASIDEASTLCHALLVSLAKWQSRKISSVGFPRGVIA